MSTLIGLDIGTSSISAVAADAATGEVKETVTITNGAAPGSAVQDAAAITQAALELSQALCARHAPVAAIGVAGQMHGILYLDRAGHAVSPLYTWQDSRGNLPCQGGTYASVLSKHSGYALSSGYGLVSHFINWEQGLVPPEAVAMCTIGDYAAMRLARRNTPLLHASNAASMGCYSLSAGTFDRAAVQKAGLNPAALPVVTTKTALLNGGSIPVAVAIGDNQASVLGTLADRGGVLINVGTGSQVSAVTNAPVAFPEGDVRPYVDGRFLLVGAPLCGGRAYALLHRFFLQCAQRFGGSEDDLYAVMNDMAAQCPQEHTLTVDPRFCGTRSEPSLRGAVLGISEDNFTPEQLTRGVLFGMAAELRTLYGQMPLSAPPKALVGSGNAVRKNPVLREYLAQQFGLPLLCPVHREEAAFGAAVFAAAAAGVHPDTSAAQKAMVHVE